MVNLMYIFFDVDGVLIDGWHSNPALRKPWNKDLDTDLGINPIDFSNALFAPLAGETNSRMHKCTMGVADLKQVLAEILPGLGFHGTPTELLNYWLAKDANISEPLMHLVTYLGGRGCREQHNINLNSIELHIATSQEHYRADYLWNELELSKHFTSMQYTADIGYSKEDVRFYDAINNRLGIPPDTTPLFFDDSLPALKAARAAGWNATQYNSIDDVCNHPGMVELLPGSLTNILQQLPPGLGGKTQV